MANSGARQEFQADYAQISVLLFPAIVYGKIDSAHRRESPRPTHISFLLYFKRFVLTLWSSVITESATRNQPTFSHFGNKNVRTKTNDHKSTMPMATVAESYGRVRWPPSMKS